MNIVDTVKSPEFSDSQYHPRNIQSKIQLIEFLREEQVFFKQERK